MPVIRPDQNSGAGVANSGTSMPAAPLVGALFFRSDLNLLFMWDGTRWLTTNTYQVEIIDLGGVTTALTAQFFAAVNYPLDVFVTTAYAMSFVQTTNTGAAFWTLNLSKVNSAGALTALGNFNTSADSPNVWAPHTIVVNAAVSNGTFKVLQADTVKTSTPGAWFLTTTVEYRLIGT